MTVAALLGLGGKVLETGAGLWRARMENARGGVALGPERSSRPAPGGARLGHGGPLGLHDAVGAVPFSVGFVAADAWARAYLRAEQPVLLVIEEQDGRWPVEPLVGVGVLGDGFYGVLAPGGYLLGAYVFLDPDPRTWDDIDGGALVDLAVHPGRGSLTLEVAIEAVPQQALLSRAPRTIAFHSGQLDAGQAQAYTLVMERGVDHDVLVLADDPHVDFDLHVLDQYGNLVAMDRDPASDAYCRITPSWTGPVVLEVTCFRGRGRYEVLVQA